MEPCCFLKYSKVVLHLDTLCLCACAVLYSYFIFYQRLRLGDGEKLLFCQRSLKAYFLM